MVDFSLDGDQLLLRDVLREFVDTEIRPVAHEMERSGDYPTEIVEGLAAMGLFGLTIPQEYGGLGASLVTLAVVFEEISRGWMGVAGVLGSHSLACWMIAKHGTPDQKEKHLPDLATGSRRTGIALTEPGAGSDLQGITTTAKRRDGGYEIDGTKSWITNARHADPLPVLVKTDPDARPAHKGMSVLLVDQGLEGFEVFRDMGKLGYRGPETCEVAFDSVVVSDEALLGGVEGRGLQQVLSALEVGRINVAARSVGIAQAALDMSLGYSSERTAFGQPIRDFQAVQLKLADLATNVQAARLMTWWAASEVDAGGRSDVQTAMAKVTASEIALTGAVDAMRIHGAYGYSTEFDVERLYRDAPLMAIGEGTNDILRTVIARGL